MSSITFKILSGDAPFRAHLDPMVVPDIYPIMSIGTYSFMGVPDGYYTLTVTDSLGCQDILYINLNVPATTTSSTTSAHPECILIGVLTCDPTTTTTTLYPSTTSTSTTIFNTCSYGIGEVIGISYPTTTTSTTLLTTTTTTLPITTTTTSSSTTSTTTTLVPTTSTTSSSTSSTSSTTSTSTSSTSTSSTTSTSTSSSTTTSTTTSTPTTTTSTTHLTTTTTTLAPTTSTTSSSTSTSTTSTSTSTTTASPTTTTTTAIPTTTTTTTATIPQSYGYLYNHYALTSLASSGWHVPTDSDWHTLALYLDAAANGSAIGTESAIAGGPLKQTGTTYWLSPNTGATNSTGFNGRGGGYRDGNDGHFGLLQNSASYGTSTNNGSTAYYYRSIFYNSTVLYRNYSFNTFGYSVRLIRNSAGGSPSGYVGNDGHSYGSVIIGTQEWMSENLQETLYNNSSPIPNVTSASTWIGLTTGALCTYVIPTTTTTTTAAPTTTTTTTVSYPITIYNKSSVATSGTAFIYYSIGSSGTDISLSAVNTSSVCGSGGTIYVPSGQYLHIGVLNGSAACVQFNVAETSSTCPATATGYCGTVNAVCSGGFVTSFPVSGAFSIAINVNCNGTTYTTC